MRHAGCQFPAKADLLDASHLSSMHTLASCLGYRAQRRSQSSSTCMTSLRGWPGSSRSRSWVSPLMPFTTLAWSFMGRSTGSELESSKDTQEERTSGLRSKPCTWEKRPSRQSYSRSISQRLVRSSTLAPTAFYGTTAIISPTRWPSFSWGRAFPDTLWTCQTSFSTAHRAPC